MSDQEQTNTDNAKALFTNLVMMLASSAMQQLGAAPNPVSGKTEIDLQGAEFSIDMLEMLRMKTTGNVDDEEQRMLTDVLSSLQMNYVQASKAKSKESADGEAKAADSGSPEEAAATSAKADEEPGGKQADVETPPESGADHEPRFHKSYG